MARGFGEYLTQRRNQLQLTRQRVADESGLSYAYLAQLESGRKSSPSPTVLGQLAGVLRVSVADLSRAAGLDPGDVRAVRAAAPVRRTSAGWHANPLHVPAPAATVAMPLAADELAASPSRARRRRQTSELAAAREELLPALERLLAGYTPTTRLALLNVLQARAIRELGPG